MRTTIDIEGPILDELKRIKKKTAGTLSEVVNTLLAEGLTRRGSENAAPEIEWFSQPLRGRVDLDNKDAVQALLEDNRR